MRVSKEPLAPLRNWKELIFGDESSSARHKLQTVRDFLNVQPFVAAAAADVSVGHAAHAGVE